MKRTSKDDRELATSVLKAINLFVQEFEGSLIKPNIVFMNLSHYNSVKDCFPYLIKNLKFYYNKEEYRIIITRDTAVGLGYTYHTDHVLEYNK